MGTIARLAVTADGYAGTIRTLTINVKIRIETNAHKKKDQDPDFRVYLGGLDVGAAWRNKTNGEEPRDYLSVQLDDPSFPEPIRAVLFDDEDGGGARLKWTRQAA